MRLWIGLHLPQLALDVFSPSWLSDASGGERTDPGSVVLEQERVLAMSPAARAAGIRPGMRRGGVLMLMPGARLHERSPAREAEALDAVALAMLQFTPQVAQQEEATLLLDIGASLRLFGGIRALCARVRASLRTLGFSAAISCAPTARGAWLLARAGSPGGSHDAAEGGRSGRPRRSLRALRMASLERRLARLPVALLPPARPYLAWFEGIGCERLGELRRLPRPGLQRRCGRALLDMLDAAHGLQPELFDWVAAPDSFRARLELFDRIEQAELLLAGAHHLVLQLTGWLCARQLAVERITLLMEHERGRVAMAPTALEIALAEPGWRDEHLVRLLKERLARQALPAPVIGLGLEARQLRPMAPPTASLFPEPGGSEEDRMRMLELLVARLGPENVLQALPQADYRPEVANEWVPVQELRAAGQGTRSQARLPPDLASLPRPSWLLAKPIALLMRNHRPFYGSPLRVASTPERIEAGWWSETQTRDYFIAEGQDHALYWIYRERIVGAGEDAEPRWYLHGLFG
ncbi:DNA polymerase Y family protein [Massilia oculi]|uniref:DNA polymerase Y family protein n=1 Tax=Massilia hydrophila TaxID=3044279 RepID=A0ABS7Y4Z3_9BURK|nr:DNA polymerase Y family protein [Massilia oculi]MCA1854753.1 DNA polymerase Y family protein [Massilia oculi]